MIFGIDITSGTDARKSLESWLNVNGIELIEYVLAQKRIGPAQDFLNYFGLSNDKVLEGTLSLKSLHVTTNRDNCASIKEFGLLNLKDTLRLNTDLGNYIREQGIIIDIDGKVIEYKGKSYDISTKADYAMPGSKEYKRDRLISKIYEDYQINAFLCRSNVLLYGGGVSRRPEFLGNLAAMLENENIVYDWAKSETKCYVLKFSADISEFEHYTFDVKVRNEQDYERNKFEYELTKRKWLIENALTVMFDDYSDCSLPEFFSYAKSETKIPISNINIYTSSEYLEHYLIE